MKRDEELAGSEPLYIQIYEYYRNLITLGRMKPGERLPSIRRCAMERQVSKTTVESSYMQLAAEGYIQAVAGSGYYVSEIGFNKVEKVLPSYREGSMKKHAPLYDFASGKVDYKSFNFELWKRYMKSALRNTERLVAYGDPQGEYDLRVALMNYVKEARGVVCSPEQIVIGAGVQSMLGILCSLTGIRSPICFTGTTFKQGQAVFEDRGFQVFYRREVTSDLNYFKDQKVKMLYTFPSHMSAWGEVMPMKTRLALLDFAQKENCLIIEDDYDSEFRYYTRPVPSLQSLDGGQNVIYIGSFSRLLLPSLRIGFMVLPVDLMEVYEKKGHFYNQTASTAEQIALCQFIRDGHLKKQIKKARKLYLTKAQELCSTIHEVFKNEAKATAASGGFLVRMEVNSPYSAEELASRAEKAGVRVKVSEEGGRYQWPCLLLSCSGVDEGEFKKAVSILKEAFEEA